MIIISINFRFFFFNPGNSMNWKISGSLTDSLVYSRAQLRNLQPCWPHSVFRSKQSAEFLTLNNPGLVRFVEMETGSEEILLLKLRQISSNNQWQSPLPDYSQGWCIASYIEILFRMSTMTYLAFDHWMALLDKYKKVK